MLLLCVATCENRYDINNTIIIVTQQKKIKRVVNTFLAAFPLKKVKNVNFVVNLRMYRIKRLIYRHEFLKWILIRFKWLSPTNYVNHRFC